VPEVAERAPGTTAKHVEEIRTYCRILTAIAHTIALQAEVDEVYTQVEKSLLQF
jgi:hypothetical protein